MDLGKPLMINGDALEQLTLGWLKAIGWAYGHGDAIAPDGPSPERTNWRQTILWPRRRLRWRRSTRT